MTEAQFELLVELIDCSISIATHPQTPPQHWLESRESLMARIRGLIEKESK